MKLLEDGGVTKVVSKLETIESADQSMISLSNIYPGTYRKPLHGA